MEQINERHPEWEKAVYQWMMIRDAIYGETAIKLQNELYLPMPAAMKMTGAVSPSDSNTTYFSNQKNDLHNAIATALNPNYHTNAPYQAYKTRAQFPEITSGVMRGLLGIIADNPPSFELPTAMAYLEETCTKSGSSLNDFYLTIVKECLSVGRVGISVDIDEVTKMPVFVTYSAESVTNWKGYSLTTDEYRFKEVITSEFDETGKGIQYKLTFDENGIYTVEKYVDGQRIDDEDRQVTYKGKAYDSIPFVIAGSTDITPDVDISPMAQIARTAIQIYQMDADLRQAEYMTCNPSLVISGVGEEFIPQAIGSTLAIVLPPEGAKAYYTTTDSSGLKHISDRISSLHEKAISHGVALVGGAKAESGDALRIRQQSNNATLFSAAQTAAKAIEQALRYIADMMGVSGEVEFKADTDFGFATMTPQEMDALVRAWQSGAISQETMLDNYRRAGILQEGETIEDEIDRIADQAPSDNYSMPVQQNNPANDAQADMNAEANNQQ